MNTSIDRKRTMEAASNNTWESKTPTKRTLPRPTPKFTVTYSRLCDGGAQEMSTAVCCVREIFPDSSIATHRRTSEEDVALGTPNPEVLITTTGNGNNGDTIKQLLWSSKQRNLYQKYPKKRKKSMKGIRKALETFKTSLEFDLGGNANVLPGSSLSSSSSSLPPPILHTTTTTPLQTSQSPTGGAAATQSQIPPLPPPLSTRTTTTRTPQTSRITTTTTSVANEVSEDFSTAAPGPSEDACEDGTCCIYQPLR